MLAEKISLLGWAGIIIAFSGLFLTTLAKEEIKFKNLKVPFKISTLSRLGSFFWFFTFAITYVTYIKTLGQIEFILGILMSAIISKKKSIQMKYLVQF